MLHILVQSRRNTKAATRFFKKLLKGPQYVPRVIVTDKLKSSFQPRRHLLTATDYRAARDRAFSTWREITGQTFMA